MTDAEKIAGLEEQVRWWVRTCSIKDDQYRALLAFTEAYVSRMVPREG